MLFAKAELRHAFDDRRIPLLFLDQWLGLIIACCLVSKPTSV
jgi:hypothetical protein